MKKKFLINVLFFVSSILNFALAIMARGYDVSPLIYLNSILISLVSIYQLLGDRYG